MDDLTCPAFHLEEYRALRAEIGAGEAEILQIERIAGIACAAIWLWIFGNKLPAWKLLGFVPTLVVLFGCIRSSALYGSIARMAVYIRELESRYACSPLIGWERHLEQQRRVMEQKGRLGNARVRAVGASSLLYWSCLIITTLILGFAYAFGHGLGLAPTQSPVGMHTP